MHARNIPRKCGAGARYGYSTGAAPSDLEEGKWRMVARIASLAGRPPPADRVTYFFQTLMHACMSLYECTQDVPETPSGALKVHKLCASSKYVVCDHLGCVERRSSGLRVHVYMCT